jgi:nicotinamidase-related amidase
MKKILVVIDMQNDFIDGPLGTPEAVAIVDKVCDKIRGEEWDHVYYTLDTHFINTYSETQEGKKLPIKHCFRNSPGWLLNKDIMIAIANCDSYEKIEKDTFGSNDLAYAIDYLLTCYDIKRTPIQDIELTLVGVCTDICVVSNALLLKAHYPEMKIVVDASCCAGSTPEKHRMALEVMKSCQVDVLNDAEDGNWLLFANVSEQFARTNPISAEELRTLHIKESES